MKKSMICWLLLLSLVSGGRSATAGPSGTNPTTPFAPEPLEPVLLTIPELPDRLPPADSPLGLPVPSGASLPPLAAVQRPPQPLLPPGSRAGDLSEQFRARQLIVPLGLVAVSTFGLWDRRAQEVNRRVQGQFLLWRGERGLHFDDYVQYLPAASYLLLGVAGAKSRHSFKERVVVLGTSWLTMGILVNGVKYAAREQRPDSSARNAYPSGHTATAFMGAELVRREYGAGYGAAAYVVACGIGAMRLYNNRHWLNDVIAGAGIGILSAEIGCWMLPLTRRWFGMQRNGTQVSVAAAPFYDLPTHALGAGVSVFLF